MKPILAFIAIIGAVVLLSGSPAPAPTEARIIESPPVVVGSPPGEIAALRTEIESLKAQLAAAHLAARPLPVVQPAATVRTPPVAAGGVVCTSGNCGPSRRVAYYRQPAQSGRWYPGKRLFGGR